jgi:hypothetical protein
LRPQIGFAQSAKDTEISRIEPEWGMDNKRVTRTATTVSSKKLWGSTNMLYKFKSKAAGDVIMLQANGKRVLDIIGRATEREYDASGILQAAQMQDAINALNAAIDDEEAEQSAAVARAVAEGKKAPPMEAVSLRQRAHPMIEMLKRCQKAGAEIVWGV